MASITGVTFPIPKHLMPRFFSGERPSSSSPSPYTENSGAG